MLGCVVLVAGIVLLVFGCIAWANSLLPLMPMSGATSREQQSRYHRRSAVVLWLLGLPVTLIGAGLFFL